MRSFMVLRAKSEKSLELLSRGMKNHTFGSGKKKRNSECKECWTLNGSKYKKQRNCLSVEVNRVWGSFTTFLLRYIIHFLASTPGDSLLSERNLYHGVCRQLFAVGVRHVATLGCCFSKLWHFSEAQKFWCKSGISFHR